MVLHAMRWPDEIRDPAAVAPPNESVSEEEIEGALALMESMARDDLDGPEFEDTYTDALAKIIEAKREDRELPEAPEPEKPAQVLDLMAALTESVEKAAARKTAKKQSAKKTAAKKATGRRPRSAYYYSLDSHIATSQEPGARSTGKALRGRVCGSGGRPVSEAA
jgi:DNA end-binding protein Ku